jgi:thiol-disulfide isomerase/thioredoxin
VSRSGGLIEDSLNAKPHGANVGGYGTNVLAVLAGDAPEAVDPGPGTVERRLGPSDRVFKLLALVGGLILIGFIVFVAVRGPAESPHTLGIASLESPPPAVLHAGAAAPAFSLPRLGGGAPVTLTSLRGTPVIINFFASWCPHCRSELAALGSVAAQSIGRVAVVGVDSNDGTGATAQKLLVAAHATYPVGVDAGAHVASAYLLQALPVTYFLNADGQVVGSAFGSQSVTSLQRWVTRLTTPAS